MAAAAIRAGRVLAAPGHAPPLGPSAVTVRDGRIAAIDPVAPEDLTPAEAGLLLMPALANAHDHGRGLRPLACGVADLPLEEWLPELARMPRVDPYLNAVVAFARMAESGIAAANHCHNTQDGAALLAEAEAVSRAARDVGIAIAFAWPFFDRNPLAYGELAAILPHMAAGDRAALAGRAAGLRPLETNLALMARAEALEHAHFRLQYAPVGPQWAAHETLVAIARRSAADGRRIHMHLLETQRQREYADAAWPDGLIPYLDEIGLLSPRLTVAHAVWLRPEEYALLARRGVTVSINPSSNLRLRSGTVPLDAIRAARLDFAIGLDGMSLDDDDDMLRELRLFAGTEPRAAGAPPGLSLAGLLDAALVTGRRTVLGDDDGGAGGGRLAPGAPADMLALDYAGLARDRLWDAMDPLPLVVGRAARRHVRALWVAGRQVVANGACVTVDAAACEAALLAQAKAAHHAGPPDTAAIARLREGLGRFHAGGGHRDRA